MKTKLKISNLEVQSFVTTITPTQISGGAITTIKECVTGIHKTADVNACLTNIQTYQACPLTGNYPTLPIKGCVTSGINVTYGCPTFDCPTDNGDCRTGSFNN